MTCRRGRTHRGVLQSGLLGIVLAVMAGCGSVPGDAGDIEAQRLPVDSLVLAPGQDVMAETLRLSFLEVGEDSRCPVDVVCVWQGNAAVRIALGLGMGPSHPFVLNTSEGTPGLEFGGYRVTLLALAPVPRTAAAIRPEAYRASFRVVAVD